MIKIIINWKTGSTGTYCHNMFDNHRQENKLCDEENKNNKGKLNITSTTLVKQKKTKAVGRTFTTKTILPHIKLNIPKLPTIL